jgi:hypothetical protein
MRPLHPPPDPAGEPQGPPATGLRLNAVAEEFLEYAAAFRVGPDRLPPSALRHAEPPLAWVAYWYRDHGACAPTGCACWENLEAARHPRPFGGEGVLLAAYADGRVGIYALDHGPGEAPLDWTRTGRDHPRLTSGELAAVRTAGGGGGLRFTRADDGVREPACVAASVWEAWDAGMARFGLWQEPAARLGGPGTGPPLRAGTQRQSE